MNKLGISPRASHRSGRSKSQNDDVGDSDIERLQELVEYQSEEIKHPMIRNEILSSVLGYWLSQRVCCNRNATTTTDDGRQSFSSITLRHNFEERLKQRFIP
ncbi:hypothetical protein HAX54_021048, partial [Datura stramonium]|nr:hypothetical protein [Datura stramonium]